MPSDLERLPVSGAGPAVLAAELTGRVRAELPVIGALGERDQVLVAAWLTGLRSARTRRAYAGDLVAWLDWLAERDTEVLAAGRVHVDLWAATWLDAGAAASSVRRRLSALSSFYRYCAAHDLAGRIPTQGVARPAVDPDYTATVGLDRDQARALVAAADADAGPQALRTAAVVRLLLHNALRVDEACAADIADLGEDSGHRVLRVTRKGARKAKVPLTPATMAALEAYLAERARRAGVTDWRQLDGPLLATAAGGRLRQGHLWELVRRLARTAGIGAWEQLSPHSLRHSAITFALDAGAALRDVQDYAGHKDPRTTRRYDHSRDSLDRNAAYTVAAYLALWPCPGRSASGWTSAGAGRRLLWSGCGCPRRCSAPLRRRRWPPRPRPSSEAWRRSRSRAAEGLALHAAAFNGMPDPVLHLAARAMSVLTGLAALEPDPRAPGADVLLDAALQAATGLQQLLAFRHDCTTVTTPAEQAAATARLTSAAAELGKAAEALHGLIELAEMTGRTGRTGKTDLN